MLGKIFLLVNQNKIIINWAMQTIKIKYQIFKVVSKLERHLLINEKQLNISIYLYFSNLSLAQISTEKRKKGEKEKRITPLCHTPKIQYSGKKIKSIYLNLHHNSNLWLVGMSTQERGEEIKCPFRPFMPAAHRQLLNQKTKIAKIKWLCFGTIVRAINL